MPTPPRADPTTLTLLLGRLARLNESAVTEVCADHGTTPAEVRVLSLLVHRAGGAASPSDIATFVVQTSGGLTATLRRLETDGHVDRVPDPDDGRGRLVVLAESGRAFHDRVLDAIVARTMTTVGGLDLAAIDMSVRSLVEAFETAQGLPSSAGFVAGSILDPAGSRS